MNIKTIAIVCVAAAVVVGGYLATRSPAPTDAPQISDAAPLSGDAIVSVTITDLSEAEQMGRTIFNAKCAACHGENAAGRQGKGPPLVHNYYRPGHHNDAAFLRAARQGVQSHHWQFGNMPPVAGISNAEVSAIVTYIRALQTANGIY